VQEKENEKKTFYVRTTDLLLGKNFRTKKVRTEGDHHRKTRLGHPAKFFGPKRKEGSKGVAERGTKVLSGTDRGEYLGVQEGKGQVT